MNTLKTALSTIAVLAIAGSALAADFVALDVNKDGQLSFNKSSVGVFSQRFSILSVYFSRRRVGT